MVGYKDLVHPHIKCQYPVMYHIKHSEWGVLVGQGCKGTGSYTGIANLGFSTRSTRDAVTQIMIFVMQVRVGARSCLNVCIPVYLTTRNVIGDNIDIRCLQLLCCMKAGRFLREMAAAVTQEFYA